MSAPTKPKAYFEWAKLQETDSCLEWPFALQANGYSKVYRNGRVTTGHRAMAIEELGSPPSEIHHAAHSCHNRKCINKRHLSWKAPKENAIDAVLNGSFDGENNPASKLTGLQVAEIRAAKGSVSQSKLADIYGVTQPLVSLIHGEKIWKS